MSGEWRWWLAELVLATSVGLVSAFVTEDNFLSAFYGVFAGILLLGVRAHIRTTSGFEKKLDEWELKALNWSHLVSYLQNGDPYLRKLVRSAIDEVHRLAKTGAHGEIVVRAHSIQDAALDFIKQAKPGDNVFATSYINPRAFWCSPEGAYYRETCFKLAKNNVQITRVFIEADKADADEKQCILEEIERQKGHPNVQVRRAKESEIPKGSLLDIFLIYDRYVAYLDIGGSGGILAGLKIYSSREQLEIAKDHADKITMFSVAV